jgi:hypothetical protein
MSQCVPLPTACFYLAGFFALAAPLASFSFALFSALTRLLAADWPTISCGTQAQLASEFMSLFSFLVKFFFQ